MANNCLIKTVTLAPGENYVLPSGAQVMYTSNSSAITSSNNCLSIPNTVNDCYFIRIGQAFTHPGPSIPSGSTLSNLYPINIYGVEVNGEYMYFPSGPFTLSQELQVIGVSGYTYTTSTPQNSIFKAKFEELFGFFESFNIYFYGSTLLTFENTALIYQIKIPKQIGDSLKLFTASTLRGVSNFSAGAGADTELPVRVVFEAQPYSEWDGGGNSGLTLLPCTNG